MGVVFDFVLKLIKSVPVLIRKVMTIILLIFTLGLFIGYATASSNQPIALFIIPVIAMAVMWYKLDEGVLVLILLLVVVFLYPRALGI